MKQSLVINKKWILTTSLLAVLATQYSFQTSSLDLQKSIALSNYKNAGEFVLASNAVDEAKHYAAEAKKQKVEEATKLLTESGLTVTGTCKDCETPATSTKAPTIEELLIKITTLEKTLEVAQIPKTTVATDEVASNESDCEPARSDESRTERRERIQCEKAEKAEIKKQKEQDKVMDRVERFEDKMADLKARCNDDLECLTSGFTSALSRYEGRNALPKVVVNKEFKSVVGAALNNSLASDDNVVKAATHDALRNLMEHMPEQYKDMKKTVLDTVEAQFQTAANTVNSNYAQLSTLTKDPQAYIEANEQIKADHFQLNTRANEYTSTIVGSLKTTQDMSAIDYYKSSYLPDMKKIMASIGTATTTTTTTLDKTNNTRDSRSNTTTTATNVVTSTTNDKMTLDKTTNAWLLPTEQSGVQSGAATTESRGGRGPK